MRGSASGSDNDPDQVAIDESLASEGMTSVDRVAADAGRKPGSDGADTDSSAAVNNAGEDEPAEGKRGEADAATG